MWTLTLQKNSKASFRHSPRISFGQIKSRNFARNFNNNFFWIFIFFNILHINQTHFGPISVVQSFSSIKETIFQISPFIYDLVLGKILFFQEKSWEVTLWLLKINRWFSKPLLGSITKCPIGMIILSKVPKQTTSKRKKTERSLDMKKNRKVSYRIKWHLWYITVDSTVQTIVKFNVKNSCSDARISVLLYNFGNNLWCNCYRRSWRNFYGFRNACSNFWWTSFKKDLRMFLNHYVNFFLNWENCFSMYFQTWILKIVSL